MKKFMITVDTEPDGQWDLNAKETTKNAEYILRFQALCEEYGFKPVYLTDYVMAQNELLINNLKGYLQKGTCEVGMHLHAWDTPPFVELDNKTGARPYLIEYPVDVMEEKIANITSLLENTFETKMLSHRAGRWAINEDYINILKKYGYVIDCSATPFIDWSKTPGRSKGSKGTDYSDTSTRIHRLYNTEMIEVPVTVRKISRLTAMKNGNGSFMGTMKRFVKGDTYWFRPALCSIQQIQNLYDLTCEDEYIEMMIHSSELMPGGSPYFKDEGSVEKLFQTLQSMFSLVCKTHKGATLSEMIQN